MPRHDPIPRRPDPARAAAAWEHYRRTTGWMAVLAVFCAGLSLLYLHQSGETLRLHLVIATILGVGLTILVGTALLGLVFYSSRSGHDDETGRGDEE